jgi:hypothetical protein
MSGWLLNGKPFKPEQAEEFVGFVYLITNLMSGKKYIGKKLFQFSRSKKIKGSSRRKHTKIVSDWETYYGSNRYLNEDVDEHGSENFKREIIRLCKTKAECNYYEAKEQFETDAILRDDYYNSQIMVRVHRNHNSSKWR